MTREDYYAIVEDTSLGVELLEIPYSGGKFSMVLVKPSSKLDHVEEIINTRYI